MSQERIIEELRKEGELPTKDLASRLNINTRAVWSACKRMLKYDEIELEIRHEGKSRKIYWKLKNVKK